MTPKTMQAFSPLWSTQDFGLYSYHTHTAHAVHHTDTPPSTSTHTERERQREKDTERVMDDTLIAVSLLPMRMVTKLNRKSRRAPGKSGHHNVPGKNREVSRAVHSAPLCVICQYSPSGTCRIQILTTVQTFRQRISLHPKVLVADGDVTNSK